MGINLNQLGYNDTRPAVTGSYEFLQPGGYVCQIVNAKFSTSKSGKQMIILFVDIAEGEYKGHFKRTAERTRYWNFTQSDWDNAGTYRQLITDKSGKLSPFFKGLLSCIESSLENEHPRFNINDFEAAELIGKYCGFVFGEEEFLKKDNSVGKRVVIKYPLSTMAIHNNQFSVPELKKLPNQQPVSPPANESFGGTYVDPDDVPF